MYMKTSSVAPFLFQDWDTQSTEGLLAALMLTTTLAVLRDCLAFSLHICDHRLVIHGNYSLKNVYIHIRRASLHMLNTGLAYMLMLCVMTYNIWLLVIVSLGAGLGHFFLRPIIEWLYIKSVTASLQHKRNMISLVEIKAPADEHYLLNSHSKITKKDDTCILSGKNTTAKDVS